MSATNLTFNSLREDMAAALEKGRTTADPVSFAQIPRIINDAERSIATVLKLKGYEKTVISHLEAGVCIYAKPERWRETVAMSIQVDGKRQHLYTRDYTYLRTVYPDETITGTPEIYADHGYDHWVVGWTPDEDYPWEIKFYQMPKLLSDDNQSNWLTTEAPNLLKNRCMRDFAKFLGRLDKMAVYDADYQAELAAFASQDMKQMMDRAAERDGA